MTTERSASVLGRGLPFAVGLIGLLLVLLSVRWEDQRVADAESQAFSALTERLRGELTRRVGLYRYGLNGTRAALSVQPEMSRDAFRRLIAARALLREFPGALGIGYIRRVMREDVAVFLDC